MSVKSGALVPTSAAISPPSGRATSAPTIFTVVRIGFLFGVIQTASSFTTLGAHGAPARERSAAGPPRVALVPGFPARLLRVGLGARAWDGAPRNMRSQM